ncbi:hypothetical protein H9P43_002834 [Blastocladiella emersonii ATCC 22665]|nr:hypothetical protein H9P43_002834 [Blastocladiella emersonii ATCC 22665]
MPRKGSKILLYGATGFTGKKTVDLIVRDERYAFFKSRIVLAGRSQANVEPLADAAGLPWRACGLDNDADLDAALADVRVVIHMAGPFLHTAEPMLHACIRNKCDYLDITGEQPVFRILFEKYAAEIASAGILAISGVGFDIVPMDCLAAKLAEALPGATHLEIALAFQNGMISGGTAASAIESMVTDVAAGARVNGVMKDTGVSYKSRRVLFPTVGDKYVSFAPLGSSYATFFTTGIPNIDEFMPSLPGLDSVVYYGAPLFKLALRYVPFVKSATLAVARKFATGPPPAPGRDWDMDVWAEVRNATTGAKASASVVTPEGYLFTAYSSLEAARRVFDGRVRQKQGPATPGMAFGADFVTDLPDVKISNVQFTPATNQQE